MISQSSFNAQIVIVTAGGKMRSYDLSSAGQSLIGRLGGPNDIPIDSPVVTSQHGVFLFNRGTFTYTDLGSTNGSYINGRNIAQRGSLAEVPLRDNEIITIAPGNPHQVSIIFSLSQEKKDWKAINVSSVPVITIGRNDNNTIVIPHVSTSRNHAEIRMQGNQPVITDLRSTNGTFLNSGLLRGSAALNDGDVINIGNTKITYTNGCLVYATQRAAVSYSQAFFAVDQKGKQASTPSKEYKHARMGGVEVRVENVSRTVSDSKGGKKKILDDISLTIASGELVAILGGSGAGKTTFMNCINGFEPADTGKVFIDNCELYGNYNALKSKMGYVPQQDIVHEDLTLRDMLRYTGKLRLPREDLKATLDTRVNEVIDMVDLGAHGDTLIKKMSGGQRKRASIAVELLSDPPLMFLDEPTSGLDPEAETSLMTQLRKLSDKGGKTVVVVTHTLQNIKLFDKVIFLAPGGKLCFYGSPEEALRFFEVDNLTDAYRKILNDIDGYVRKFNATRGV